MQSTKTGLVFVVVCLFLLSGCSVDPKADFDDTQKLLDASEHTIQQTFDYEVRIKCCDDAIGSLNAFLVKHPKGEWPMVARNALSAWESKKVAFQQEFDGLLEQLATQLRQKAIEQSKKVHSFSNIELINLDNRVRTKQGYAISFADTYSVRMKGSIIGTSIFKLVVHVSGRLQMDAKTVFVDEKATVEE